MSRCFSFTPRGCVRKGVNTGEALIESIKLQNAEKSQMNRKKKKTRKEEGEKLGDICDGKIKSVGDQKAHEYERRKAVVKRKHSQNGNEQVERSDLTEEHGQPLYFQNPAYLSDSTKSSDKRKNNGTLLSHSDHPEKRRVMRIRINTEKQSDRKKETVEKQSSSCAKRPDEAVNESKRGEHCSAESKSAADSINKCKIELHCLATGNQQISTRGDDKACSTSSNRNISHKNGVEALELQYKNLIDLWTPERLQFVVDNVDDADWIFGTTHAERPSSNSNLKRYKATTAMDQTCRSISLWPRVQYLPEAGIYGLPYSLPY